MRLNDLIEMAIPVGQGEKVWKEINDLLNQNKYEEAAKKYLEAGGNVRGLKRTWNVAQANNKVAAGKVPGPIYGLLDKKHSLEKFKDALPSEEKAPKKNRERNKSSEDMEDTALSYKTMADKRKAQALNVKDGNASGSDLARKMSKNKKNPISDPVGALEADAKRFGDAAKGIKRYEELRKRDEAGEKLTIPERKELSDLKKSTMEYRTKKGAVEQAKRDFQEVETVQEIKDTLNDYIKRKIRIDDRKIVVDLLKKIKEISSGDEAVDLSLLMKRVFRSSKKDKSLEKLIDKTQDEIGEGQKHLKAVDNILNKYDNGEDISKEELASLKKEIEKFLPVMKEDRKWDLKGYTTYANTAKRIGAYLAKNKDDELNADDIEEILDDLSTYHTEIKKPEPKKKKRSLKEDILFNLK
jgi:hypothetical protein